MGNEADCDTEGKLFRAEEGKYSEILMTNRFGINSSAAGLYECTANNTIEVNTDRVNIVIPGMKQLSLLSTLFPEYL